jgi:hypothetical protein
VYAPRHALSLVGGAKARGGAARALPLEKNATARVGITQALGSWGRAQDVAGMRTSIEQLAEPELQSLGATAMAFHGTPEALEQLGELSVVEREVRACAARPRSEGLGHDARALQPLAMSELSRKMNYTVMPDWAQGLFQDDAVVAPAARTAKPSIGVRLPGHRWSFSGQRDAPLEGT